MPSGRIPKTVSQTSQKHGKQLASNRQKVETALKGDLNIITPSSRLNSPQKKIFNFIVGELAKVDFLGSIDIHLLEQTCIAIDRLHSIEKLINQDFDNIRDKDLMSAKSKYTRDFEVGLQNLPLSPASRAKFGILMAEKAKQEGDPLLKILRKDA